MTVPSPTLALHPAYGSVCRAAGVTTVADVLARTTWIRDLPERANGRLDVGGMLVHVKRAKAPRAPASRECEGIAWARAHDLPAPEVVFAGFDARHGAFCGTRDLAPARPLDELVREDLLTGRARRRTRLHLAGVVARMHDLRVHHRDLYLNHVFVDPTRDAPVVSLIDWDRADGHRRAFGRWVVKDLASLEASAPAQAVGPVERLAFLAEYLAVRGALRPRRLRRLARRVARKAARIRAHRPRTPVGEAARPAGGAS